MGCVEDSALVELQDTYGSECQDSSEGQRESSPALLLFGVRYALVVAVMDACPYMYAAECA